MKLSDLLIPQDKANHVIYGALVYLVVAGLGQAISVHGYREAALLAALAVGVLKELWDGDREAEALEAGLTPTHSVDPLDAVATFAGALIVYLSAAL
jgi:hypothetical protein